MPAMNLSAMFIAALILLPAFGLASWGRWCVTQVLGDLRISSRFEGMRFEV
jgi:hypothetical protein